MVLAGDESTNEPLKVYGFLASSEKQLPNIDKEFCEIRLASKLWAKINWKSIPSKKDEFEYYLDFINVFLNNSKLTFHCIVFDSPSTTRLREYYGKKEISEEKKENLPRKISILIRSLSEMLDYYKHSKPFYLLVDQNTELKKHWEDIVNFTRSFREVEYCNEIRSSRVPAIQIADLLVGAVTKRMNNIKCNNNQEKLIKHIEESIGYNLSDDCPRAKWGKYKINIWVLKPLSSYSERKSLRPY